MSGCVQVYTGNGKGKTTAAFGLALRAAGNGLRVYIAQFAKHEATGEAAALRRFEDLVKIEQFGSGSFITGAPRQQDMTAAQRALAAVRENLASGKFDMAILDEANIAVHYGLISADELLEVIRERPRRVEIVITGRHAHEKIISCADLVTDMREVKHYFAAGVPARKGIEY